MKLSRIRANRAREEGTGFQPSISGRCVSIFGNTKTSLELETDPTPERPQNRSKHHPRISTVHRHIALRQQVAEVRQGFPAAIQSRQLLPDGEVQIRIDLISGFAKLV